MKRKLFVALCFATAAFVACQTTTVLPSIGVTCANPLDASAFGFTLSVPADFACITVEPNSELSVFVRYRQGSTGPIISIAVPNSGTLPPGCGQDPNCENLPPTVNPAALSFVQTKFTATAAGLTVVSFSGFTQLPSGLVLGITVVGFSDDPALKTTFDAVVNSVALAP